MRTSEETTNLMKAMIASAPEIRSIAKNKQAYGYKYATLDSLIDMLRDVLPKHGLWFTQMPTRTEGESVLTTRVFHESGEWLEDSILMTDTELQGKANDTQKLGASITYFRRYVLSSIFGVSADEDVDGNLASKERPQQARPQPTAQKIDSKTYLKKEIRERIDQGATEDSVLGDFASILGTNIIKQVDQMTDDEARIIAISVFNSKKKR